MRIPSKKIKSKKPFYKHGWFIAIAVIIVLGFGGVSDEENDTNPSSLNSTEGTTIENGVSNSAVLGSENNSISSTEGETTETTTIAEETTTQENTYAISKTFNGKEYKVIEVAGGDLSGLRQSNVAVDVGFGTREYWAFTNEYGQLIAVTAQQITLQDPNNEPVLSTGRYFEDEAKVPGTEDENLDEGHVIADSLGGVSNAYNITPQDSTLNRYGDQAYMEKVMRDAGGCTNFIATITYDDNKTQIPSHYKFEYELNGSKIVDEFDNVNPDEVNASITTTDVQAATEATTNNSIDVSSELARIDKNGNGQVTIAEAKAAGFKMPIYSNHWLYQFMDDRDGDGKVGE